MRPVEYEYSADDTEDDGILFHSSSTPQFGICQICGEKGPVYHEHLECGQLLSDDQRFGKVEGVDYYDRDKAVFRPCKLTGQCHVFLRREEGLNQMYWNPTFIKNFSRRSDVTYPQPTFSESKVRLIQYNYVSESVMEEISQYGMDQDLPYDQRRHPRIGVMLKFIWRGSEWRGWKRLSPEDWRSIVADDAED